jgi:hypothetical protein
MGAFWLLSPFKEDGVHGLPPPGVGSRELIPAWVGPTFPPIKAGPPSREPRQHPDQASKIRVQPVENGLAMARAKAQVMRSGAMRRQKEVQRRIRVRFLRLRELRKQVLAAAQAVNSVRREMEEMGKKPFNLRSLRQKVLRISDIGRLRAIRGHWSQLRKDAKTQLKAFRGRQARKLVVSTPVRSAPLLPPSGGSSRTPPSTGGPPAPPNRTGGVSVPRSTPAPSRTPAPTPPPKKKAPPVKLPDVSDPPP